MSILSRWTAKLSGRRSLLAKAERQAAYWRARKRHARKGTKDYSHAGYMLAQREKLVRHRRALVAYASRVVARHRPTPLREKAYQKAAALVGVMESGGNNAGPTVTKIIRANGGTGPEPWCGDFMAYVYRLAGSKAVTRSWAAVRLLGRVAGVKRTSSPQRGDLVRFRFDHVGMFVRHVSPGVIETIEGNTGASGAVSDGNGHDGVYRKRRSTSLVADYLRVSR